MVTKLTSTLAELLEYAQELSDEVDEEDQLSYQTFSHVAGNLIDLIAKV